MALQFRMLQKINCNEVAVISKPLIIIKCDVLGKAR